MTTTVVALEVVSEASTALLMLQTSLYQPFPSLSAHAFSTNSQDWVLLSHKDSNRESNNHQCWLFNKSQTPHSLKSAEATAVSALNQLTLPSLLRQRTEPSPLTVLSQSLKPLSSAKKTWLPNNQSARPKRTPSVFSTTRTEVLVPTPTAQSSPSAFLTSPTDKVVSVQALDTVCDSPLYFERSTFYCLLSIIFTFHKPLKTIYFFSLYIYA